MAINVITEVTDEVIEALGLPDILYKYREWNDENHKKVITERKLYFASPDQFEDVLDCRNDIRYEKLTDDEIYEFYLQHSLRMHPHRTEAEHHAYAAHWTVRSPVRDLDHVRRTLQQCTEEHDKRFGVLSLSHNPNRPEMWEKYANDSSGFLVGIDVKEMIRSFRFGGGIITYCEEFPTIKPIEPFDDIFEKQIMYKLRQWEFEEEYRLIISSPEPLANTDRAKVVPASAYKRIILGRNMPANMVDDFRRSIPPELSHIDIEMQS